MARFSIWESDDCVTLKEGDEAPPEEPGARLVKAFDALTWEAACQVQYDHYDWGTYKPMVFADDPHPTPSPAA